MGLFILQFLIGGFTAGLMFVHHRPVWGCILIIAMLAVLFMNLAERLKGKK
ncbi:hypothetical protein [Erwinia psidii]|uniref:hypothetical protein n=1 Tax=Erwinia psidii TaxID=69224 RepID=UPI00226BB6E8|nr:hypothetical protein [Erwinia psidii]